MGASSRSAKRTALESTTGSRVRRGPGQAGHPGGVRRGPRSGAGQPVGDHLDDQLLGTDQVEPPRQDLAAEVVAPQRGRAAQLGGRAEQHPDVPTGRAGDVLGDQLGGAHRGAALAGGVGRRDQPAHRRPPAAAAGQEGHPGQPGVAGGTAADRSARPDCAAGRRPTAVRSSRSESAERGERPGRRRGSGGLPSPSRPWRTGPRRRCRRGRSARGRPSPARRRARRGRGGARRRTAGSSRRRRGGGRTGRTTQWPALRPRGTGGARSARARSPPARGTGRRHAPGRRPPAR